jgi:pimeloyl-ACP methyl ester carboxylesterase
MVGLGRRFFVALIAAAVAVCAIPITAVASTTTYTGTFADGAKYIIELPGNWNGTLLLYSHGYTSPFAPLDAASVGDATTGAFLLARGYALAGSSYATNGWALEQAFPDQIATLDVFDTLVGRHPSRTIAWGHSLGGIITAGLLQLYPQRFDAALPMCGVLSGGIGAWNQGLDAEFVIQQLLGAGTGLQLVRLGFPNFANLNRAGSIVAGAQGTAQGRARLALAAAVSDAPGWFDPSSPEPGATDYVAQQRNQYLWLSQVDATFLFFLRGELEARAGGNPSWNTGVNYAKQLERSIDHAEVVALYAQAGLSLDADLARLAAAPRISADPGAVDYLNRYISFNGDLGGKPVLTIHTTGDGLVLPEEEQAYRSVVLDAKDGQLLREAFVHRAGHCTFTPAETIAALQALETRLDTGKWTDITDPGALNSAAAALGSSLNLAPPSYLAYEPPPFLRPYDLGTH